jgi:hypothetical protein
MTSITGRARLITCTLAAVANMFFEVACIRMYSRPGFGGGEHSRLLRTAEYFVRGQWLLALFGNAVETTMYRTTLTIRVPDLKVTNDPSMAH